MTRTALSLTILLAAGPLVGCADGTSHASPEPTPPAASDAHSLPAEHPPLDASPSALPEGHPPIGDHGAGVPAAGMLRGDVLEAIDAGSYTYVRVTTDDTERWLAGPRLEVEVGDEVLYPEGTPMKNWRSDRLDRTWDEVLFVGSLAIAPEDGGFADAAPGPMAAVAAHGRSLPAGHPPIGAGAQPGDDGLADLEVQTLDGGLTVAQIWNRGSELTGGPVALRGRVVKANLGILGTNWFHVRDGSGDTAAGTHDLTVRSLDEAKVGDTVVVRGQLVADQDFGGGYRYDLIVEEAALRIE